MEVDDPQVVDPTTITGPKSLDIDIIACPDPLDPKKVKWDIDTKDPANPKKIKAKDPENYLLKFKLFDNTTLEVRFDASSPFYCKDGTSDPCPSSVTSDQVLVDSCKDNELVVLDWNVIKQELRYQLNFVTKAGKLLNPYDPIIDNGGGGHKL